MHVRMCVCVYVCVGQRCLLLMPYYRLSHQQLKLCSYTLDCQTWTDSDGYLSSFNQWISIVAVAQRAREILNAQEIICLNVLLLIYLPPGVFAVVCDCDIKHIYKAAPGHASGGSSMCRSNQSCQMIKTFSTNYLPLITITITINFFFSLLEEWKDERKEDVQ